jgi:hypothetical protein
MPVTQIYYPKAQGSYDGPGGVVAGPSTGWWNPIPNIPLPGAPWVAPQGHGNEGPNARWNPKLGAGGQWEMPTPPAPFPVNFKPVSAAPFPGAGHPMEPPQFPRFPVELPPFPSGPQGAGGSWPSRSPTPSPSPSADPWKRPTPPARDWGSIPELYRSRGQMETNNDAAMRNLQRGFGGQSQNPFALLTRPKIRY